MKAKLRTFDEIVAAGNHEGRAMKDKSKTAKHDAEGASEPRVQRVVRPRLVIHKTPESVMAAHSGPTTSSTPTAEVTEVEWTIRGQARRVSVRGGYASGYCVHGKSLNEFCVDCQQECPQKPIPLQIQNALRLLTRVMKTDEEIVFMPRPSFGCVLCGRDKFDRPYQPHRCVGGFRKRLPRFKPAA